MQEIFKSSLFDSEGYPIHIIPLHNVGAVANNKYYIIGKMIATCIIQEEEAPACFAKPVADYIVYDKICSSVCLNDIPDMEVRDSLRKVGF